VDLKFELEFLLSELFFVFREELKFAYDFVLA